MQSSLYCSRVAMYCHGIPQIKNWWPFVLNSYIDKLYIKMLRFSKEIDWYHPHQQFLWHDILLFQLFGPALFSAHVYGSLAAADTRLLVSPILESRAKITTSFYCFFMKLELESRKLLLRFADSVFDLFIKTCHK